MDGADSNRPIAGAGALLRVKEKMSASSEGRLAAAAAPIRCSNSHFGAPGSLGVGHF